MSRSYVHTPVFPLAAHYSEKADKRIWHRRWRSMVRTAINGNRLDTDRLDEVLKALSSPNVAINVWSMAKDGKRRWDFVKKAEWLAESYGGTAEHWMKMARSKGNN